MGGAEIAYPRPFLGHGGASETPIRRGFPQHRPLIYSSKFSLQFFKFFFFSLSFRAPQREGGNVLAKHRRLRGLEAEVRHGVEQAHVVLFVILVDLFCRDGRVGERQLYLEPK
ncbi:MAG: hypothetical protein WB689_31790 [Xanthobacteraceae bacterium]